MSNERTLGPTYRLAAITLLLTLAAFLAVLWLAMPIDDLPIQLRNKDFVNYWMAGRQVLTGEVSLLFGEPESYHRALMALLGDDLPWHNWSYPPHFLFYVWPLGLLSYLPAMVLFLGVTLVLYLFALATLRLPASPLALMLLAPFIVANLVATQNGFLTAALMIGGLGLRQRRPIVAGILFGLLTIKPQLGLMLPLLLLYERNWTTIFAAVATSVGVVILSALVFGLGAWHAYIADVMPYQAAVMAGLEGDFAHMLASPYGSARSLGLTGDIAMRIHLPLALVALGLYGICLFRLADGKARAFATVLATFLVTPYATAYDMGALAAFAAFWPRDDRGLTPLALACLILAILPIAMLPLGQAGLPLSPAILAAALALLLDGNKKSPPAIADGD